MSNLYTMFNLQLFAEAGNVVNVTTGTVNAYTGTASTTDAMTATMKTFYDTELLENAREKLIFQQLGRKQSLPSRHGKVVEWRKWNTLPEAEKLQEAVIPEGKRLGMTSITVAIDQYGEYVSVSDQLELHAVDDVILGATEELGAAAGKTFDKLVRGVLTAGTNVLFADVVDEDGKVVSTPTDREGVVASVAGANNAYFTPDMINKAVTVLKKANAPTYSGGKYMGVIHPSCTYDLRSHKDWIDVHKYSATGEIFNGEIGELHGVRFVETTMAPVIKDDDDPAIYQTMIFGRDAFGVVDPQGAGMETIIKGKGEVGGPLNQFSTIGTKFSMAAKVLYPERYVIVESASSYSEIDAAN